MKKCNKSMCCALLVFFLLAAADCKDCQFGFENPESSSQETANKPCASLLETQCLQKQEECLWTGIVCVDNRASLEDADQAQIVEINQRVYTNETFLADFKYLLELALNVGFSQKVNDVAFDKLKSIAAQGAWREKKHFSKLFSVIDPLMANKIPRKILNFLESFKKSMLNYALAEDPVLYNEVTSEQKQAYEQSIVNSLNQEPTKEQAITVVQDALKNGVNLPKKMVDEYRKNLPGINLPAPKDFENEALVYLNGADENGKAMGRDMVKKALKYGLPEKNSNEVLKAYVEKGFASDEELVSELFLTTFDELSEEQKNAITPLLNEPLKKLALKMQNKGEDRHVAFRFMNEKLSKEQFALLDDRAKELFFWNSRVLENLNMLKSQFMAPYVEKLLVLGLDGYKKLKQEDQDKIKGTLNMYISKVSAQDPFDETEYRFVVKLLEDLRARSLDNIISSSYWVQKYLEKIQNKIIELDT